MFNTIKSKIIFIAFSMLIALSFILAVFSYIYLKNSKSLIITSCSYTIGQFVQDINKDIIKIENNARELALNGELHHNSSDQREKFEEIIKRVFQNYPNSLGGGIWFKPFSVNNLELYCIYAFRNKSNEVVIDRQFETPEYNFPNQNWYKEITSQLIKGDEDNIVWSRPYFEHEGSNTFMVTAGSGIYHNEELVGITTVDWEIDSIIKSIKNMRPTPNSFALFADKNNDFIIVSTDPYLDNAQLTGKSLKDIPWYRNDLKVLTYITYQNKKFIPYVKTLDNGMMLIVCVPKNELFHTAINHVVILFFILIIISLLISVVLYLVLNNNITRPINALVDMANKISDGNLNTSIRIKKPKEFARLASTFDKMTKDILSITKQREKIETELSIAKKIQLSSLPSVFPPYPERYDLDIYASMNPALNVGGDFYDFYFIDKNKFLFLVADVSGKGVPAALFMMIAKTIMRGAFQNEEDINFAIKTINDGICQNNTYNYFVTTLVGIMDLEKEKLTLINCGHNPPLIKRRNGSFEYIKLDSNIILGAMPDIDFKLVEIDFKAEDEIFIYTDGVTEAMNEKEELFGEERLKNTLNSFKEISLQNVCKNIKDDIDDYSKEVEQTDDITMLAFKYYGKENTYKNLASKENYKRFNIWLNDCFERNNIPNEMRQNIELSFEEIYTNIFSYAYPDGVGEVEISINKENDDIILRFVDWGIPYNPLNNEDPDINLSSDERPIGGLGIFMVKQLSKGVEYKYENANILTVKF